MLGKTVRSDLPTLLGRPAGRFSNLGFQAIPENRYNWRWYAILLEYKFGKRVIWGIPSE